MWLLVLDEDASKTMATMAVLAALIISTSHFPPPPFIYKVSLRCPFIYLFLHLAQLVSNSTRPQLSVCVKSSVRSLSSVLLAVTRVAQICTMKVEKWSASVTSVWSGKGFRCSFVLDDTEMKSLDSCNCILKEIRNRLICLAFLARCVASVINSWMKIFWWGTWI